MPRKNHGENSTWLSQWFISTKNDGYAYNKSFQLNDNPPLLFLLQRNTISIKNSVENRYWYFHFCFISAQVLRSTRHIERWGICGQNIQSVSYCQLKNSFLNSAHSLVSISNERLSSLERSSKNPSIPVTMFPQSNCWTLLRLPWAFHFCQCGNITDALTFPFVTVDYQFYAHFSCIFLV